MPRRPRRRPRDDWRVYSERDGDGMRLRNDRPPADLPPGAELSGDGNWAEIRDAQGLVRVLVRSEPLPLR